MDYNKMTLEQLLEIVDGEMQKINDIIKSANYHTISLVEQIFEKRPELYLLLKDNLKTENYSKICVKHLPNIYDRIPEKLRTDGVKLAMLEVEPANCELFDAKDFSYETVKYLYINYPFMLENFESNKTQRVVGKIVARLKKEKVQQKIYEEE